MTSFKIPAVAVPAAMSMLLLLLATLSFGTAAVTEQIQNGAKNTAAAAGSNLESTNGGGNGGSEADQSGNNIAFDLPDLTKTIETADGGEFQIEAYKSINNDRILESIDRTPGRPPSGAISQLSWVSVGQPMFVRMPDPSTVRYDSRGRRNLTSATMRLFHFPASGTGFYAHVQMLTPAQRGLLAATASTKYGVAVSEAQVVNLILSKFECSLIILDEHDGRHLFVGKVTNFRSFPLRVDFKAPPNSNARKLFVEQLQLAGGEDGADLAFSCQMTSRGRLMRTNTLTIGMRQQEQIGLVDKLFGPTATTTDSVYVTRDQLTELAAEMYSTLNIIEDYQIPEVQFSEAFVNELVNQVAISQFTMVPVDAALDTLCTYGFDYGEDLQPDRIRRDLGQVLVLARVDGRVRIGLNETKYGELREGPTATNSKAKRLGVAGSAEWARSNAAATDSRSVYDQLRELNGVSHNDIRWAIEGERIVPKNLNLARIGRSLLTRTLTFQRVQRKTYNAAFDREFGLYTMHAVSSQESTGDVDAIAARLAALESGGSRRNDVDLVRSLSEAVGQQLNPMKTEILATVRQMKTDLERHVTLTSSGCRSGPSAGTAAGSTAVAVRGGSTSVSGPSRRLITAQLNGTLPDSRCVWGLAVFKHLLYVVRAGSRDVEIYDQSTLTMQSSFPIPGAGCFNDMASCPGCDVVYVVDNCFKLIHVLDEHGVHVQWSVGDLTPLSVSIASGSNALLTFDNSSIIREYTPTGELVRQFTVQTDLGAPTHAIQLPGDRYLVGQGNPADEGLHRVCVVDAQGRVVQSYGAERGSGVGRLRTPARMALVDGSLLVVDSHNDRIILLNAATMSFVREVVSEPTQAEFLIRIALSDDSSRMYLAHNNFRTGSCVSGHAKAYNLRWM